MRIGNGESSSKIDALTLSAREVARQAVNQWAELEEGKSIVYGS
jgi:hypothetical protein